MPFFRWRGINFFGETVQGKIFARSELELENFLLSQDVGLLSFSKDILFFIKKPKSNEILSFISNLSLLLNSGLRLQKSLEITSKSINNTYFKFVILDIANMIDSGSTFKDAIYFYKNVFGNKIISFFYFAEKSYQIGLVLEQFSIYLQEIDVFKKRIKSVCMGPVITFIIFFVICIFIFSFVIPKFKTFFSGFANNNIPFLTQTIFNISDFFLSKLFLITILGFLSAIISIILISKFLKSIKLLKDKLILKTPIIGKLIVKSYSYRTFKTLSVLLSSSLDLVKSLYVIQNGFDNIFLKSEFEKIINKIENGELLSRSVKSIIIFNSPEIIPLLEIAEISGSLKDISFNLAEIQKKQLYEMLDNIVLTIQPMLLSILGIMTALLMIAIYVPILNLYNNISI